MMAHLKNKFLDKVWRSAMLLGHTLEPWSQDRLGRYSAVCSRCGIVITLKISLRLHDMSDAPCPGKKETDRG